MISQTQRPVPDYRQHSKQENIRATDGVRTRKTSKPAVADPRLRPRGHPDQAQRSSAPLVYSKVEELLLYREDGGNRFLQKVYGLPIYQNIRRHVP